MIDVKMSEELKVLPKGNNVRSNNCCLSPHPPRPHATLREAEDHFVFFSFFSLARRSPLGTVLMTTNLAARFSCLVG
jgi:hypothetical protein